jgi:hypothetical protein
MSNSLSGEQIAETLAFEDTEKNWCKPISTSPCSCGLKLVVKTMKRGLTGYYGRPCGSRISQRYI